MGLKNNEPLWWRIKIQGYLFSNLRKYQFHKVDEGPPLSPHQALKLRAFSTPKL
jgi:hypothetical protein